MHLIQKRHFLALEGIDGVKSCPLLVKSGL